jgi:hypothetical protein
MMGLHLFDLGGKWFLGNHPSIHPSIHHDNMREFNSCAKNNSSIHPSIHHDKMRECNSCAKNNCNGKLDRRAHIRKTLWGNTLGTRWGTQV